MKTLVPPIKCQGIKTKLVPVLRQIVPDDIVGRWIEPFCGSGVVPLNLRPTRAILSDANPHIMRFYEAIREGEITAGKVRSHLEAAHELLKAGGQEYYNEIRARFNESGASLDFLFLNRSCFNGVMRFNKKGGFNVPFCHKPERFAPAYITKIVNQVSGVQDVLRMNDWRFESGDYRATLDKAGDDDFVYVDPPYFGRHADYFNSWSVEDEDDLTQWLKNAPCRWALSTWHSNEFRENETAFYWESLGYYCHKIEHFYHVGASEDLRHPMIEAVFTNFDPQVEIDVASASQTLSLFA